MSSDLTAMSATWHQHRDSLKSLRTLINVTELRVPHDVEFDSKDPHAKHVLIQHQQQPIACGRITTTGIISRICVLKSHRQLGLGALVLKKLVEFAADDQVERVSLSAKLDTIDFYAQYGFTPHGQVFMSAGVPRRHAIGNTEHILKNI